MRDMGRISFGISKMEHETPFLIFLRIFRTPGGAGRVKNNKPTRFMYLKNIYYEGGRTGVIYSLFYWNWWNCPPVPH